MTKEYPADFPDSVIKEHAFRTLYERMEEQTYIRSRRPLRTAGFCLGWLVVAAYLDVLTGPLSVLGYRWLQVLSVVFSVAQVALLATGLASLVQSRWVGGVLQRDYDRQVRGLQEGRLCPLSVLGARKREPLTGT